MQLNAKKYFSTGTERHSYLIFLIFKTIKVCCTYETMPIENRPNWLREQDYHFWIASPLHSDLLKAILPSVHIYISFYRVVRK